jgi:hypothetical protein
LLRRVLSRISVGHWCGTRAELVVARRTRIKVATSVAVITRSLTVAERAIVAVEAARVVRSTIEVSHWVLVRDLVFVITSTAVIVVAASIAVISFFSVLDCGAASVTNSH